jgi:hypothetical protein
MAAIILVGIMHKNQARLPKFEAVSAPFVDDQVSCSNLADPDRTVIN